MFLHAFLINYITIVELAMAVQRAPYFLFIPGILHTPAHFQPIIKTLSAAGYESGAVALPNVGVGAATAAPLDDTKAVTEKLKDLVANQKKMVTLVCHSYGGIPGCQAATGFEYAVDAPEKGGVQRIVFLNAFIVKEGENALDALIRTGQEPPPWIEADVSSRLFADREGFNCSQSTNPDILRPNNLVNKYLFNDLDDIDSSYWASQLLPISAHHQTAKVERSCWNSSVPKLYIFSTQDKALWPNTQSAMLNQVKDASWTTLTMESGHAPFLSRIDQLVHILTAEWAVDRVS